MLARLVEENTVKLGVKLSELELSSAIMELLCVRSIMRVFGAQDHFSGWLNEQKQCALKETFRDIMCMLA